MKKEKGRNFDKTLGVCLTSAEMEKLNKSLSEYCKNNGVVISKSQFVRLQLKAVIS